MFKGIQKTRNVFDVHDQQFVIKIVNFKFYNIIISYKYGHYCIYNIQYITIIFINRF